MVTCQAIGWRLNEELPEIERVLTPGGTAAHVFGTGSVAPEPVHGHLLGRGYRTEIHRSDQGPIRVYWKRVE